ncbi:hypothetical protein [Falsiroseomonas oryzae]|nr:hypothetical protein [Roseomonas sp. MO-31]
MFNATLEGDLAGLLGDEPLPDEVSLLMHCLAREIAEIVDDAG